MPGSLGVSAPSTAILRQWREVIRMKGKKMPAGKSNAKPKKTAKKPKGRPSEKIEK
jgi:hypothetical protein